MYECPYCHSDLSRPASRQTNRTDAIPGSKTTGAELVNCPDCGRVIDGFSAH